MKNKYMLLLAAFAILAAGCTQDLDEASVEFPSTVEEQKILNSSEFGTKGSILVRFNAEAEKALASRAALPGATRSGVSGVDALLDEIGGYSVKPIFMVTDANRDKVMEMGLHLWYKLSFDEEVNLDEVAKRLATVGEVDRVQFNERVKHINRPVAPPVSSKPITSIQQAQNTRADNGVIPFSDGYRLYQWGLNNDGTNSYVQAAAGFHAVAEADVNAVPAWRLCTGDPTIVVAVVDEGVMYTHEDIKANYHINLAELNGARNVDDDRNGFVDDIYGYNFTGTPNSEISWNAQDDTGHGTHVAGIVSAVNNNNIGISSIAGGSGNNDGVKVFSVQIFDGKSGATLDNAAMGIQYAADRGAHILQCSWGYGSGTIKNDNEYRSGYRVEVDALSYFVKYGGDDNGPLAGGLPIFAAGNDSSSLPSYPGAFQSCICVTSIGPALKPAYYTNYGLGSDIGAPGGDFLWGYGGILSAVPEKFSTLTDSDSGDKIPYDFFQGTSMACPMVSGVAALGLSYAKQLGKRYTVGEFRSMLLSAVNDFDPFFTGVINLQSNNGASRTIYYSNYQGKMGSGFIDAYKLLLQIDGTPFVSVATNTESSVSLAPIFGDGVKRLACSKIEISDEDKEAIGLQSCDYNNGNLVVKCTKSGNATVTVTLLVGGDDQSNINNPRPVTVTKSFVLIAKESVAGNNGWL